MIKRSQRVRLAAAELGNERKDRGGVIGPAGEPAKHHPRVFPQGSREIGTREELRRVAIILRRCSCHNLLERDGELIRIERPPFSNFLARRGDFVPRLHQCVLRRRAGLGSSFRIWLRTREAMATAWRHSRIEISPPPRIPGGSGIVSQTILLIFGKSESGGGGKQLHELPNAVSLRKRYIARVNSAFMYFSITCCA